MNLVMKMTQIIYADILLVVNSYVTYFLLRLSGIITSSEMKPVRLMISSLLGGVYSLILLLPMASDNLIVITRILASVILIICAYKIENIKHFLKLILSFFCINFAFAGLMFGIYYSFKPSSFLYNSGIIYFNIDTISLLVLTMLCYFVFLIAHKLLKFKTPVNLLYELTIFIGDKSFKCKAFLDTGNSVSDPFTSEPVIIVNSDVFIYEKIIDLQLNDTSFLGKTLRYIPCKGISNFSMLPSIKPDKMRIKGINIEFYITNAYIAITNNKIKNGEFDALLNSRVFENKTNEKGEDYETKTKPAFTSYTNKSF